jgi:NADH dehydrogenase/NADH:ubiquinone oxidoreductase subunit G
VSDVPTLSLEVDGEPVRVPEGSTLLEAVRAAGKDVPTLCYHPVLEPIGACRICVVEVEGSRVLVPACIRRAEAGMRVWTDTPRVRLSRRMVTELLQSSTDASLAPELQRYAAEYGARPQRWEPFRQGDVSPRPAPKLDNELYVRDLDRCILCYRCVRACGAEVQNTFAIAVAGRGLGAQIDPGFDLSLPESACVFCGNCVAVCPTEALVPRTQFEMRRAGTWDESRQRVVTTVCPYCGVGCKLELHVQDNRIVRVTAPLDDPHHQGLSLREGPLRLDLRPRGNQD